MVDERESVTAKLCAFARAWHAIHERDKIFEHDLAFDLIGKEEYDAMYAFWGLPTAVAMLPMFADIISPMRYGIGLTFRL